MTTNDLPPSVFNRVVYATIPKAEDIEVHVSTIDTKVGVYVEIREYVPSLQQYGRGVTEPIEMLQPMLKGLQSLLPLSADENEEGDDE